MKDRFILNFHLCFTVVPSGRGFQPHMQRSGMWGYADDAGKGVLQGRYKLQMMVYNAIYIRSFFQNSTVSPFL
ncbi:hypothetical protein Barb4_00557 [Bacteroidales bacterium Barb4]|nr:hypothetical protein Barb4_00557 [Bacteroidales bacterium Barb4]